MDRDTIQTNKEKFRIKPGTTPYRVFLILIILYSFRLMDFTLNTRHYLWWMFMVLWVIGVGSSIGAELKASRTKKDVTE